MSPVSEDGFPDTCGTSEEGCEQISVDPLKCGEFLCVVVWM